jgi:hypothetical protein
VTEGHPVVERYLTRFEASITEFDCPEQEEITHEIRSHIAEARAAGRALDAVLQTLGPADVLARAYAVELALNPQGKRRGRTPGRVLEAVVATGARPFWALGRFLKAFVTMVMRPVWALGRFLRADAAVGTRRVRALGGFLRAVVAAGMRRVWAVGRLLRRAVAAGVRRVWGGGRLLRTVVTACMRRALAVARFLRSVVAAGMRSVWGGGGFLKAAALGVGSLVAAIAGLAIGAIGIGLTASGLFMVVIGPLDAAGLHLANAELRDMPLAVAMTVGPMLIVSGGATLALLRLYIQFLVTTLQRVFPATQGTALARAFSG